MTTPDTEVKEIVNPDGELIGFETKEVMTREEAQRRYPDAKLPPDTEWEKEFDSFFNVRMFGEKGGSWNPPDVFTMKAFIQSHFSSRDTYWKERVRKEVEGMKRKITFNGSDESGFIQYGQVIDSDCEYNQALDTLLDNLK